MTEYLLNLTNIRKSFGNVKALQGAGFTLKKGEVHALLGANGAGKSTLMKIIAGAYKQDEGEIVLEGNEIKVENPQQIQELGISIVYQEFSLINDLSIAENIFMGRLPLKQSFPPSIDRKKMRTDSETALQKIGVSLNVKRLVSDLSVGEQQIVEIAKAISINAKVLILDEPTSALNAKEIERLFALIRVLKANDVGIIYITHRMNELEMICDRVTIMRDGRDIGTYHIGEKTINEMVDLMLGEARETAKRERINKTGNVVLQVDNLSTPFLQDISLTLHKGEIVGLAGQMGAGRTELLKALFGADKIKSGSFYIEDHKIAAPEIQHMIRHGVGFVSEDRKGEGIFPGRAIRENIVVSVMRQITQAFSIKKTVENETVKEAIEKTDLHQPLPERSIEFLSGGNQQKAVLGRWLAMDHLKILLLDEPTRGIDIGAKGQIYELLHQIAEKGIGILIASSDADELVQICDRVIILEDGKATHEINDDELTLNSLTAHIVGGGQHV